MNTIYNYKYPQQVIKIATTTITTTTATTSGKAIQ